MSLELAPAMGALRSSFVRNPAHVGDGQGRPGGDGAMTIGEFRAQLARSNNRGTLPAPERPRKGTTWTALAGPHPW